MSDKLTEVTTLYYRMCECYVYFRVSTNIFLVRYENKLSNTFSLYFDRFFVKFCKVVPIYIL